MTRARRRALGMMLWTLGAAASAATPVTDVMLLSGDGTTRHPPVAWEFSLDRGRGGGTKTSILVPSNWEQQGFGAYYYGTQGRGKPDDDPVIPKEIGTYSRTFTVPARWAGRRLHLVFDGVMTDTDVLVNGVSAGATHQGGFYRFDYDITERVHAGENRLDVRVAKESSNTSVNRAERRGDYWTFGGIFRPVWIEARPAAHIAATAIDARADGAFRARVTLGGPAPPGAEVVAQVFTRGGKAFGPALRAPVIDGAAVVDGRLTTPALWTAETPHLYDVRFTLRAARRALHETTARFGFRTFEVRPRDGLYLNGRKIVLKGVNRHSFNSRTARTLSRTDNVADVRLIKEANMNAVRMSHYPPDADFLDAADELGLYVLDELAGWQGSYDTPTGARLIGEMIRRDVNHPSILFWDNGNEGGWNTDNDGEFARWDPQSRPVLHPWAIHDGINTDHYENYDSTVHLSAGPDIFMPTEFLHGLYDGGIGAGFRDYWNVMGRSPTVGGGFFWALVDEGIRRTDRDGHVDTMGNAAPDGMVGPDREKEGSFFAVKEIWSPVQVHDLRFEHGKLAMRLENGFDFRDLAGVELQWRALRLPPADSTAMPILLAEGRVRAPAVAPRSTRDFELPLSLHTLRADDVIELAARDTDGHEFWKWVVKGDATRSLATAPAAPRIGKSGDRVVAGDFSLGFDPATGELSALSFAGQDVPLTGPHLAAWQRTPKARTFVSADAPRLTRLDLVPGGDVIARARYDGALREVTWRLRGPDLVVDYEIAWEGPADILGVSFDFPESRITGKRWVGAGPYRIWKNRSAGTLFGLHAANYSRSTPGETFLYPEFEGFFGEWRWLEMRTGDGRIAIGNDSGIPYFGLYRPTPVANALLELPDVGWSFLHAIPPIGTKFALADVLGPESQAAQLTGVQRGELTIRVIR